MAMFAETQCTSFLIQFQKDFKKLYAIAADKQLDATLSLMRKFFKTIIGRTHEYTIEEALFILKEEQIISATHYEQFKELLLILSFFRYSADSSQLTSQYLADLESLLLAIISDIPKGETEDNLSESYAQNQDKVESELESNENTFLRHKKEIILAEKNIVAKIKAISADAHDDMTSQISGGETPLVQGDKMSSLKISFYDFFLQTIGHKPEYISKLGLQDHIAKDIVWDLYAKYHLLGDSNPLAKLQTYATSDDDLRIIEKALQDNTLFRSSSKYGYLGELQAILLLIIILVLNKKDLRLELPKLYGSFSKDGIYFVLQNLFPLTVTPTVNKVQEDAGE